MPAWDRRGTARRLLGIRTLRPMKAAASNFACTYGETVMRNWLKQLVPHSSVGLFGAETRALCSC